MKNVKRRIAENSLKTKGFQEDRSGKHIYFHHIYQGKRTGISTHISHTPSIKDISGDLLLLMERQLKLDSLQDTLDLLECTMDGDDYNHILATKSIVQLEI